VPVILDRDNPSGPPTAKQLPRDPTPPFVGMASTGGGRGWRHWTPLPANRIHCGAPRTGPSPARGHECASALDVVDARGYQLAAKSSNGATTRIHLPGFLKRRHLK
jgi:hypothetical protein